MTDVPSDPGPSSPVLGRAQLEAAVGGRGRGRSLNFVSMMGNQLAHSWKACGTVPVGIQVLPDPGVAVPWLVLPSGRTVRVSGVHERESTFAGVGALAESLDEWAGARVLEKARGLWEDDVAARSVIAPLYATRWDGIGSYEEESDFFPQALEIVAIAREIFGPWIRVEGLDHEIAYVATVFEAFEISVRVNFQDFPPHHRSLGVALRLTTGDVLIMDSCPWDGNWGLGRARYEGQLRRGLEHVREWCVARLPEDFVAELERGYGRSVTDRSGGVGASDASASVLGVVEHDELVQLLASRWREVSSVPGLSVGQVADQVVGLVASSVVARGAVKLRLDPRFVEGRPLVAALWCVLRDRFGFVFVAMKQVRSGAEEVRPPFFVGWAVPLTAQGLEVERAWRGK